MVTLYRPDGSSLSFSGARTSYGNFPEIGGGGLAKLTHNADGSWTLHDEDASVQTYDGFGDLLSIKDASGVGWTITRTSTVASPGMAPELVCPPGHQPDVACVPGPVPPPVGPPPPVTETNTTVVTHTDGQSFTVVSVVNYPGARGTVTITDPAGNHYVYSATGGFAALSPTGRNITSITFPGTPVTTMSFTYTGSNGDLLSGVAYNGVAYWATAYDADGWAVQDGAADGTEQSYLAYDTSNSGKLVATITNPLGLKTTNTYTINPAGFYLLTDVTNTAVMGCGATDSKLAWDANSNLTQTIDNDGIAHTYHYAANGQLQTETEAAGTAMARTINYAWDTDAQLNRLLSVTDPGESQVSYTYNGQNRLASVTRTNLTGVGTANQSLTTTFAYALYSDGMVHTLTVTAPSSGGSDKTTSTYDSYGNLTSVADGLGHTTTYSNYNGLGEVGKIVGPNGAETGYTYDARGRVASKTTHPNGGTATWTYAYDGFGLLAQVNAPDGEVTTWNRDAEKRVKTLTHNDKDGTSTETLAYDANGDVTSDVIARGSDIGKATTYVYNALGKIYQVKGSHGQVLTYAYDGNGNVLSVTDALGHKTSYAYDALNRLSSTTNAAGGVTHYAYDQGDHVVQVTDPRGLVTSYSYDGLGNLWTRTSPDTGTYRFTYDAYGRLTERLLSGGTPQTFAYDALNRLISETAPGRQRTYTWGGCTDGKDRLCETDTGNAKVDYSYTPEGWVAARAFSFPDGPVYDVGYAYNAQGQVTQVAYPDGNQAIYYYTDGAVSQVNLQVGTYLVVGVNGISYRPMDLAMSGWTSYNGLTNRIDYDSDLRPTSITVPGVESLAFSYDADNRITHISNGIDGSMTQSLGYDALNRLVSESSGADNESYSYDADGNRLNAMINGVGWTYTPSGTSNRLESVSHGGQTQNFTYDPEGDMWAYGPGTPTQQMFYYNVFDRLNGTCVNGLSTHYHVSAAGQRLYKYTTDTATYFAPDTGGKLLAEDQNGDWMDYVWLNGRLVTVISNGGVFPVATDQTGRPLALTHPTTKAILWQAQGLPFDRTVTGNSWGNFNVGFPGQYYDEEDGLWYNGARDYDASLGRYIESDPIGLAGGINTYVYAGNNPVSRTDRQGKLWITAIVGAATGGFAGYETGGWKGAIAGGVVGAAVGFVAPEESAEAGGAVGAMFATTAGDVAVNAAGGAMSTIGANVVTGQPWDQDLGLGTAVGAFGPLASGEAFFVGAGGASEFGATTAGIFSAGTGAFNVFGSALIANKDKHGGCP